MKLLRPGLVPYGQALAWQLELRRRLQQDSAGAVGTLICLQHPPVVTLGKRGRLDDIFGLEALRERGTEFFKIDRGGEATYHGPGQLVIYPIVKLDNLGIGVVDLIRGLAGCLSETLAEFDVQAAYDPDHPGLWTVGEPLRRKIASVGMRVSGGVSTHGAAINLTNDLSPFALFVPCGMPDSPMARLADCTDDAVDIDDFTDRFLEHFSEFLELEFEPHEMKPPPREEWAAPMPV